MTTFRNNILTIENLFGDDALEAYNNTLTDEFKISENDEDTLVIYPQNFSGAIPASNEFVRLNVLQGGSVLRYNGSQSNNGAILFSIFVPTGQGVRRAHRIADYIDGYLRSRATISGVQLTNSFLTTVGVDTVNSGLFRLDYTINFNNYN